MAGKRNRFLTHTNFFDGQYLTVFVARLERDRDPGGVTVESSDSCKPNGGLCLHEDKRDFEV